MKRKIFYPIIAIVPIVILLLSFTIRQSQGPFFYGNDYDPAYAYLVSSLNVSEFKDHKFYFHPGTTEQIIGAAVIKLVYLSQSDYSNIAEDVFSKPEVYLFAFFAAITLINAISFFFIGLIIYKATNNIYLSVFLQLSAIISFTITYELSMLKPDNLIVPVTLFLVALSIKFLYKSPPVKGKFTYEILFALICGIGLATKLTFLPLLIVPLIMISGIKRKLLFLGSTGVIFFLLLFPIYSNLSNFIVWVKNLLLHSGKYGTGNADVVDSKLFMDNLKNIFKSESYFFYTYFFVLIFLLVSLIGYFRKKIRAVSKLEYKLLISFFLSMSFTTILVAKQYAPRYMIPALVLCPVCLYLLFNIVLKTVNIPKKLFIQNAICILLAGYIVIYPYKKTLEAKDRIEKKRNDSIRIDEYIKNNNATKILTCYGSTSLEYALAFSLPFSGSQQPYYESILKKKILNNLFFEPWVRKIHSINGTADVQEILNSDGKLILKLKDLGDVNSSTLADIKNELIQTYNFKNPEFISMFSNSNKETIYEVNLK
ncbi:MAG: hypothetical protein ABI840_04735 [bacterium]